MSEPCLLSQIEFEASLYSIPSNRKTENSPINNKEYDDCKQYVCPYSSDITLHLGEVDKLFTNNRHSIIVEFLIIFPNLIDSNKLVSCLYKTIQQSFGYLGGRRQGASIISGEGVLFSSIFIEKKMMFSKPPSNIVLFEPICNNELITIRLSSDGKESMSSLGISFDHGVSDISGISLFLQFLSNEYCSHHKNDEISRPLYVTPDHDRLLQCQLATDSDESVPASGQGNIEKKKCPGGVVCLHLTYSGEAVNGLKEGISAHSRHDALFTHLVFLLQTCSKDNNGVCLRKASLGRDCRGRLENFPSGHFGNGTTVIGFDIPEQVDDIFVKNIRQAIDQFPISLTPLLSDLHLNTWWHALHRPILGHRPEDVHFAVGPHSLASALQMCSRRGQFNATVLPEGDGFSVLCSVPLDLAQKIVSVSRNKSSKKKKKKEMNKQKPVLLWLHGIGSTSDPFYRVFDEMSVSLECLRPLAPLRSISSHPGEMLHGWFDVKHWPLTVTEMGEECPQGLEDSIKTIHELLDSLLDRGIPSYRIVIGGFSQGGSLALLAGMKYRYRLAGMVCVSGWSVFKSNLYFSSVINEENKNVPVFFSCGTGDPIVTYTLIKKSIEVLSSVCGDNCVIHKIQRAKHNPNSSEMESVKEFIENILFSNK